MANVPSNKSNIPTKKKRAAPPVSEEGAKIITTVARRQFGATLKDIAERVGCSIAAVSMVVNNSTGTTGVAADVREHILKVAREMNYRPNLAARSIRNQRTHQVAVVVQNRPGDRFAHPLAYEFILGINEALEAGDLIMSMIRVTDLAKGASPASRAFRGHMLEGAVVVNPLPPAFERQIESMVPNVIWTDSNENRPERCIRRDEHAAGAMAARQIIERGYKEILYVTRPNTSDAHYSLQGRTDGIHEAIRGSDVLIRHFEITKFSSSERPGTGVISVDAELAWREPVTEMFHNLARHLRPRVAVLLNSIFDARLLLHWCANTGRRPGVDFPVVCCDDDRHNAVVEWPELSRVTFDRYLMGVGAAEMMIHLMQSPDQPCPSRIVADTWFEGRTLPPAR